MALHDKKLAELKWTNPACPTARTLDIVGDKWSLLIIRDAMDHARTFSEFHHRTGIARNILSDRLQKLTAHGIIIRTATPSGRRHEYQLSDMGHDLFPVILTLRQWGEQYAFTADESYSILVDEHDIPIPKLQAINTDGNLLSARNTYVMEGNR